MKQEVMVTINSDDVWGNIKILKLETEEFKNDVRTAIKEVGYPEGVVQRTVLLKKVEEERIKVLEELLQKQQSRKTKKALQLSLLLSKWSLSKLNQAVDGYDGSRELVMEEPMTKYWEVVTREKREIAKRDSKLFKTLSGIKRIFIK